MTDTATSPAPAVVSVQFETAGHLNSCDPGQLALRPGDRVVVQTDHGYALGTVMSVSAAAAESVRQRIVKKADERDLEREERNRARERDAIRICLHRIDERRLAMKLIKAEHAFEGGKITFYFSAEHRVDFRDLVRDLAHTLHTRIEMKQIGARDEAKAVGAVGPCGRELCCSSWLRDFGAVSVKMAKAQGLSPNPSKLAGMCGRLKCCLRYEYDTYVELGRKLPGVGTRVVSVKGEGTVTRQNILRESVTIRTDDGAEAEVTLDELVERKPQ